MIGGIISNKIKPLNDPSLLKTRRKKQETRNKKQEEKLHEIRSKKLKTDLSKCDLIRPRIITVNQKIKIVPA